MLLRTEPFAPGLICYIVLTMGKLSWQGLGRDSRLHLDPSKASALPKCLCPNLRSDVCWHLMIRAEGSFAVLLAPQSFSLGGGTGSLRWLLQGPGEKSGCWRSRGGGRAGKGE